MLAFKLRLLNNWFRKQISSFCACEVKTNDVTTSRKIQQTLSCRNKSESHGRVGSSLLRGKSASRPKEHLTKKHAKTSSGSCHAQPVSEGPVTVPGFPERHLLEKPTRTAKQS